MRLPIMETTVFCSGDTGQNLVIININEWHGNLPDIDILSSADHSRGTGKACTGTTRCRKLDADIFSVIDDAASFLQRKIREGVTLLVHYLDHHGMLLRFFQYSILRWEQRIISAEQLVVIYHSVVIVIFVFFTTDNDQKEYPEYCSCIFF